jgi:serine/threonine-protein kinase HipA
VPTVAEVRLWGRGIGAVALEDGASIASFQYTAPFARSGIEVSPLSMPLSRRIYQFPTLSAKSFHGLPGLLADALPDKFGNALIDAWLATQGRSAGSFNAIERLCYTGRRAMGALEFVPATGPRATQSSKIRIDALVELASEVLTHRNSLEVSFAPNSVHTGLAEILRVGTSAGGARAKAIIAWNQLTNEVRSGQVTAPQGFGYWLLKFDGVSGNKDRELQDSKGYTVAEYAYSLMAKDAGVLMTECRLLEENGRRHFMTQRFDRGTDGEKIHMQSLAGLAHFDFNIAQAHSYEQAFDVARRLDLPLDAIEQLYRRMIFNVVARNQDDHVKNIAFLMDKAGQWRLSPAYDVAYSYNPTGDWTARHQMTINGKSEHFDLNDFRDCAKVAGIKRGRDTAILREVTEVVENWPRYAERVNLPNALRNTIAANLRLNYSTSQNSRRRSSRTASRQTRRGAP